MSIFIDFLKGRIHKNNQNAVVLIIGQRGTGKSYASIKIAQAFDPNFTLDNNVFFSKETMVSRMKNGPPEYYKLGAFIFEEVGANIGHRNWYDAMQQNIINIIETSRTDRTLLILNVPFMKRMDTDLRDHIDVIVEMQGYNKYKKCSYARIKVVQKNEKQNTFYNKYLRVTLPSGELAQISSTTIGKLDDTTSQQYEKIRQTFLDTIKETAFNQLMHEKKKEEQKYGRNMTPDELFNKLLKEFGEQGIKDKFLYTYNKRTYINLDVLKQYLDVSRSRTKAVKAIIEKKFIY